MRKICLLVIILILNCGSETKESSAVWDSSDGEQFKKIFIADCNKALKQKEYCVCVFEKIKSEYPRSPFGRINIDVELFSEECLYLKH